MPTGSGLDATRDPGERYVDIGDRLCEAGRLGQRTGKGWYRYEPGDRTPHRDEEVEALIAQAAAASGIDTTAQLCASGDPGKAAYWPC